MNDDRKIWQNYARGLTPISGKKPKSRVVKSEPDRSVARKSAVAVSAIAAAAPASGRAVVPAPALERRREKALRDGRVEIDATLDLHGMTQSEAFAALADFMRRNAKAGKRHLLIITGKGRGGAGVLRGHLPGWLEQLPQANAILALRPAAIKHGGSGAQYVILRKILKHSRTSERQ